MRSEPPAPSRTRSVALVLALGFSQIVAFASSFYLLGVMGDSIAYSLEVSSAVVFGVFSGAMLLQAGLSPWMGKLIDRVGAKPVLLACLATLAMGQVGLANARDLLGLAASLAVMGAGMSAALYAGPNAMAVEVFGEGARRPITVISLVGGFGSTSAWLLTPLLIRALDWRGALLVWAAALLVGVIPLLALLAPSPRHRPPRDGARAPVVWDRRMLQLAVLFMGVWFIAAGMAAHLPRIFAAAGLAPDEAARTAGLLGLAAVSARLLELTVLRRLQPLVTARVASLAPATGAVALALIGPAAAPVLAILQGLGNGVLSVANGTLPLMLWGREGYATRSALLNTPAKFAQTVAPLAFALALERGAGRRSSSAARSVW